MLKTSLHVHVQGDHDDYITYTPFQLLDHAAKLGYEVIAFTAHERVVYTSEIAEYAERKNILLIPGIEVNLGGHVLILNAHREAQNLKTLDDLRAYRRDHPEAFTIAAHPFFPEHTRRRLCFREKIHANMDCFDAIEHSWFYSHVINFNKKAQALATKHRLPYIATADVHLLNMLENGHVIVQAEKNIESVLESLREHRFTSVASPQSLLGMGWTFGRMMLEGLKQFLPWYPPKIPFEHDPVPPTGQSQSQKVPETDFIS